MDLRNKIKSESGAALIVAIGAVTIMTIVGLVVVSMSLNSNKTVAHDIRQTQALSVAESGIDKAIADMNANYLSIFHGGIVQAGSNEHPDGPAVFGSEQVLNDASGQEAGRYQVYAKQDPERPGNVLLTAKGAVGGSVDGSNLFQDIVRVSVRFNPIAFNYAFMLGDSTNPVGEAELEGGGSNNEINITGNTQMNVNELELGSYVNLFSRSGYSDKLTYTGSEGGSPGGNMQVVHGAPVALPTVNFNAFTGSNVISVTLPSTASGWSKSGSTYSISTSAFQNLYGSYDVVKLVSSTNGATVKITGAGTITSTIMLPGTSSNNVNISELDLTGPNLNLQPNNGLALLAGEGTVNFYSGVNVGSVGHGALVYMVGKNIGGYKHEMDLEFKGAANIFGSVLMDYSGSESEIHFNRDGTGGTGDLNITYDPAFLSGSLPAGWWSGDGVVSAVKINFEKDPS